jgi:flavin reductase (DIM6/NTAB) family NADH-FMN oxidoreductase RutF
MAKMHIEGAGRFYHHNPRVPAIVTAHARGKDNAMAASWHSAISFKPPLIGVAIAPKRFTYQLILEGKEFGLNFLPLERAEVIAALGGSSGSEVDKFQKFGIKKAKPLRTSVSILEDAYAAYECSLIDHRTYGDHEWLVGEILATHFEEGVLTNEGILDLERVAPALYLGADFYITAAGDSLRLLERKAYGEG